MPRPCRADAAAVAATDGADGLRASDAGPAWLALAQLGGDAPAALAAIRAERLVAQRATPARVAAAHSR